MNRGFYTLGSGMITQNRSLGVISNNMANVNTTGYKKSKIQSSTFGDILMCRIDKDTTPLGNVSLLRSATESATIYSPGVLKTTDRTLDFAVSGSGFFAIQANGGVVFTRNGNFSIDEQGFLSLDGIGRVIGQNGPIQVNTDQLESDSEGNIFIDSNKIDQIAIYDFNDKQNLISVGDGIYISGTEVPKLSVNAQIKWKTLEMSNVEAASEMTDAMITQRSLQACAQALKIYDNNLAKAVEIGRV